VKEMNITFVQNNLWLFVILAFWELAWKGLALWRAARRGERYWFVAILFINTAGILPIFYLVQQHFLKDKHFRVFDA
jgi:hypothetical protein